MSEEVLRAIEERWSCRAFESTPLAEDTIRRLLGTMLRAPSAGNAQPWHFYIVTNESTRKNLSEAAYGQQFIRQAPVVFVVCAVLSKAQSAYGQRGSALYCLQDTAAAVENLLIAAESMGLGACWVGAFDESRASQILGLPSDRRPVAMVPVGRPAAPKRRTGREPEEKTATWVR